MQPYVVDDALYSDTVGGGGDDDDDDDLQYEYLGETDLGDRRLPAVPGARYWTLLKHSS